LAIKTHLPIPTEAVATILQVQRHQLAQLTLSTPFMIAVHTASRSRT